MSCVSSQKISSNALHFFMQKENQEGKISSKAAEKN